MKSHSCAADVFLADARTRLTWRNY